MGTRNLVEVIYKGKLIVSQYGQWDGYPTGQGKRIAEFIHKEMKDKKAFLSYLEKVEEANDLDYSRIKEEMSMFFKDMREDGYLTLEQSNWFDKNYPELSRNTGAGILEVIQDKQGELKVRLDPEFKEDTLFCEYNYIIDFDKETVSVNGHKGFHELPFNEWTVDKMYEIEGREK